MQISTATCIVLVSQLDPLLICAMGLYNKCFDSYRIWSWGITVNCRIVFCYYLNGASEVKLARRSFVVSRNCMEESRAVPLSVVLFA